MAQNIRPVPDYIEGQVLNTREDWRTRGGIDLSVRGATRTAAVVHNAPRLAIGAMNGLALMTVEAERITREFTEVTQDCIEVVQTAAAATTQCRRTGSLMSGTSRCTATTARVRTCTARPATATIRIRQRPPWLPDAQPAKPPWLKAAGVF